MINITKRQIEVMATLTDSIHGIDQENKFYGVPARTRTIEQGEADAIHMKETDSALGVRISADGRISGIPR